ncbi:N-acetyllactosaminide beta-1,3-N-acetylglucosaminyltransferase 2-like [Pleurodeles waltl]|uniref:N-acetyllactosaminide beta-1,3-N-acetylglucosaminyltransferase 2-like n=1 Tax=Pleurodeles waltl TaxID=8319 RepID=UPI0037098FE9
MIPVCRRLKLLGRLIMVNIVVYLIVAVSKNGIQEEKEKLQNILPHRKFWKKLSRNKGYWNKEQLKLDKLCSRTLTFVDNTTIEGNLFPNGRLVHSCEADSAVQANVKDFANLPERFKDFLLYMKCRKYSLLIDQPHKCKRKPFLLLAIKSLSQHFIQRQAIRESWGKEVNVGNLTVVRVFLLGKMPTEDYFPDLSNIVKYESETYKDILLWDYRDTFFNLTIKEVLFLKWVSVSCADVQFIFKGDDDVFVNTHLMLDYLKGLSIDRASDLFIGDVIEKASPLRDNKLKYYIPKSVYEGSYPPYAGGGGFLFSGKLALRLYNVTHQILLYPIDDVYTGMCLRKIGLRPEKHNGFKTFDIGEKQKKNVCSYKNLMLVHSRGPQEMIKIWTFLQDPHLKC